MSNNPSCNTNEKKCEYCGSDKTYMAVTTKGTTYPKWNNNPFKEDTAICGKCYRNLLYHKALPPIHVRRGIRKNRISKRICHKCGSNVTQRSKEPSHCKIWHRHPKVKAKWMCTKCYASWYYDRKRKFKTKEECYQYISKLFSGKGNPMYGNHTLNLGRVYTEERNKKVSEAVKKWAKAHPEHYYNMGILGAMKARKLGLSGLPTGLETIVEKALRKNKIRYKSQFRYGMGIMDFYLPEGNIALFVDGGIWHADPRLYKPEDTFFFGFKTSKKKWRSATAKEIWGKDRKHNEYLKLKGYNVIRFWEKEIECEIDKCIKMIKKQIQKYRQKARNGITFG